MRHADPCSLDRGKPEAASVHTFSRRGFPYSEKSFLSGPWPWGLGSGPGVMGPGPELLGSDPCNRLWPRGPGSGTGVRALALGSQALALESGLWPWGHGLWRWGPGSGAASPRPGHLHEADGHRASPQQRPCPEAPGRPSQLSASLCASAVPRKVSISVRTHTWISCHSALRGAP